MVCGKFALHEHDGICKKLNNLVPKLVQIWHSFFKTAKSPANKKICLDYFHPFWLTCEQDMLISTNYQGRLESSEDREIPWPVSFAGCEQKA